MIKIFVNGMIVHNGPKWLRPAAERVLRGALARFDTSVVKKSGQTLDVYHINPTYDNEDAASRIVIAFIKYMREHPSLILEGVDLPIGQIMMMIMALSFSE